jgi:hypothetical protein
VHLDVRGAPDGDGVAASLRFLFGEDAVGDLVDPAPRELRGSVPIEEVGE